MKKTVLALLTISLLANCNDSQTKSVDKTDRMELVPEPDKALREEYEQQQALTQSKPAGIDSDTSTQTGDTRRVNRNSFVEKLIRAPYYRLSEKQIALKDSTICLQSKTGSKDSNDVNSLHFVYYYSFKRNQHPRRPRNPEDRKAAAESQAQSKLAVKTLQSFEKFDLKLNNKNYSGIMKLAVPFENQGVRFQDDGYNLWILEYTNGKLVNLIIKKDVNIITEEHPTRTT
ncbi:MAG: hypothetical protein ACO1N0_11120 [Fluviicola sp.]